MCFVIGFVVAVRVLFRCLTLVLGFVGFDSCGFWGLECVLRVVCYVSL